MKFETGNTGEGFDKVNFMRFDYGQHRVRLLGVPNRVFTHFLKGRATIQCLGRDCPICQNNKSIKTEHPEDFRNVSGYNASSPRHYINVLDRTSVKICPECQTENKPNIANEFSPTCSKCNTFVTDVEPMSSGKVKVINISQTNADTLNTLNSTIQDKDGEPIGLENFDLIFMASQSGNRKTIAPMPDSNATDVVEVPEDALYDLENLVIKLEPDEIVELQKGVSLRDIFAARRGEELSDEVIAVDAEYSEIVEKEVADLFDN
jgi:endogenous inhibitor of DNA gyrase (YacG/DUF329 family)